MDWVRAKVINTSDNWLERKIDEALIIRGFGETPLLNRDKICYINNI
jgi:hypothetical protein